MLTVDLKHPVVSLTVGVTVAFTLQLVYNFLSKPKPEKSKASENTATDSGAFWNLVGNTPLVKIKSLSAALGCEVYGKCEFTNPGGSVKDRVAKMIVQVAEQKGLLKPGGVVFEGTSGSTGISLALACNARGYECVIYMPNDQAKEKSDMLKALGARVVFTPQVSIVNDEHYCNAARRAAADSSLNGRGFFADQFENPANFMAHFTETGEEIWRQTHGQVDAFVAAAGTGGTVAGVGACLKAHNPQVKVVLADPQGSALHGRVKTGVLYTQEDAEGCRKKIIFDTVTEGIGLNRLTKNFSLGLPHIDDSFKVSDQEALEMSEFLLKNDGLFVGSSSAVNCCAIAKAVRGGVIKKGSVVVTILCDSGMRHLSKFYSPDYLARVNLTRPAVTDTWLPSVLREQPGVLRQ
eukprot:GDKI01015625.1.p1 GENE.GDKI01015625.1~~GDKI01015625.1.p1  ORF type:complete len:407 (-),score=93.79 GDKI01015625.1:257-1477(-)